MPHQTPMPRLLPTDGVDAQEVSEIPATKRVVLEYANFFSVEYCWKVKRAADAMANAMAGADAEATRWCGRPGEYCWTKRDAEANPGELHVPIPRYCSVC